MTMYKIAVTIKGFILMEGETRQEALNEVENELSSELDPGLFDENGETVLSEVTDYKIGKATKTDE